MKLLAAHVLVDGWISLEQIYSYYSISMFLPNNKIILVTISLALCFTAASRGESALYPDGLRKWSAADSVRTRYLSYRPDSVDATIWDFSRGRKKVDPVQISPDGGRFFFITRNGNLERDCNEFELRAYSANEVRLALKKGAQGSVSAEAVVRMSATGSSDKAIAIGSAFWENSRTIQFIGTGQRSSERGVFRFDVVNRKLHRLSPPGVDVTYYRVAGDTILFAAIVREWNMLPREPRYPQEFFHDNEAWQYLWGGHVYARAVYAKRGDSPARKLCELVVAPDRVQYGDPLSLSPDGKWAVVVAPDEKIASELDGWSLFAAASDVSAHFMLADLANDRVWNLNCAAPRDPDIGSVEWEDNSQEVYVTPNAREPKVTVGFALTGGNWESTPKSKATHPYIPAVPVAATKLQGDLSVRIVEDMNTPANVFASCGGAQLPLLPPDPALDGVWLAPSEKTEWPEENGIVGSGLFILPRDPKAHNGLLPLVVQVEQIFPGVFSPDGWASSSFAAQALVAQGIAVLRLDISNIYLHGGGQAMEAAHVFRRIDLAVKHLTQSGIVDPKRVGLVGFSRTGFYVHYAITHPQEPAPAAAIVGDSFTGSYLEQVYRYATAPSKENAFRYSDGISDVNGGRFWSNKEKWLERAPAFNAEKVRTPTLFTYTSVKTGQDFLEVKGAWRALGLAFDMVGYPKGGHQMQAVRQREANFRLIVDWMCFWLKGEIPSDPERAAHWAILRKQQDEVLKTPPPPKGKWVFVPEGNEHPDPSSPAAGLERSPQGSRKGSNLTYISGVEE